MTIQWFVLVPGALLLLFPADRLLSSRVELRSFDCFHTLGDRSRARPWWWVPALWVDPLRGFFGVRLLHRAFAIGTARWATAPTLEYSALVALVATSVVLQTITRRGDRGVLLAPLGFVAGVAAGLTPWSVAAIGIATGLLGLFGFRQFHAYFAFGAIALAVLGAVLEVPTQWICLSAGAFVLPAIAGLVSGSTLELPARNSSA